MNERERKLLSLSLECSSANEPGLVAEAFRNYLESRLSPEAVAFVDDNESPDANPRDGIYRFSNGKHTFYTRIGTPQVIELIGGANESLDPFEVDTIESILRFFNEKYKTMVELRGLTYTDDVTGLYNQRYMETVIERELALAKRNGNSFAVLFIDLDHFKKVNDTHGHLVGSRILYEVGEEVKRCLRESDIVFRFGGDEFVCVLSNSNLVEALLVGERVRSRIEKKRFLAKEELNIRLTASIGVAAYPEHALTRDEILHAADEALYGGKDGSRNKVVAADLNATKRRLG
jgi:diguanylate cyclase (GGDEF)-like protein